MTSQVHICKLVGVGGSESDFHLGKDWTSAELLPVLQEAVGGFIQVVYIGNIVMIVDEEGLPKNKMHNEKASMIAGQRTVGTVLVMKKEIWESYNE